MATSYSLAILQHGSPYVVERRKFVDARPPGVTFGAGGSVDDHQALLLVNMWNQKAVAQAQAAGLPVRYIYFL